MILLYGIIRAAAEVGGLDRLDTLWASYRDANSRCDVLSGDELLGAQDQERDAVFALTKLKAPDLEAVRKKVEALIDMLKLSEG